MTRIWIAILTSVLAAAVFNGLLLLDFAGEGGFGEEENRGIIRTLDNRLYDILLRLKPGLAEDPGILLLEVDDQAISEVDKYPLPRDVFAEGLILLAEFAPAWTILDIEFVDASDEGIDTDWRDRGLADSVRDSFADLADYQRQLVDMILDGQLTRNEALEYLSGLESAGASAAGDILSGLERITYSRDKYLGEAIAYLGNVSATINMVEEPDETISPELREWAYSRVSVNDYLTFRDDPFESAEEILPSILPVISSAAWAGFPRMYIDPDGVRRRIDLLYEHEGRYYTHLGFGTWWVRAGRPPITVHSDRLETGGLSIPLDRRGKMLINWPKRYFDGRPLNRKAAKGFDSTNPKHRLSFFYLYYHNRLLEDLSAFLGELEQYGIASDTYGNSANPLSVLENDLADLEEGLLRSAEGAKAPELGRYRDEYLAEAARFLNGNAEEASLLELKLAMDAPEISADDHAYYSELAAVIPYLFSEARIILEDIEAHRTNLRERLEGAIVILGYTGTSSTDYGANPFEKQYMNVGIYGAVYNSLLAGEFLRELPLWMSGLACLLCGIAVVFLSRVSRRHSAVNTAAGAAFVLAALAAAGGLFIVTGAYLNIMPLILTLTSSYLASVIMNFLRTSKEKAFIQDAFGQIISPDLVREIQENPDTLNIAGENRRITAMFSDIEKFAVITERLGSSDRLFEFLKRYLTPMSDIILQEQGTIDKYEGDAIIAFWNAPADQKDHAHRACRAAMRMIRVEKRINKEMIAAGLLDDEMLARLPHGGLYTRIGINTGENNVGFIGTERRKDYTALGDEMNLASRLEGVNKIYGTQVLISEATEAIVHGDFITRRLERVRVVGKENPANLYELRYSKEFIDDFSLAEREGFNLFRQALVLFAEKKWEEAEEAFNTVLIRLPGDGPSKVFIERCRKYTENPPPANWDGVYRITTK